MLRSITGIHRVIEPQGILTQAAKKIDNDMQRDIQVKLSVTLFHWISIQLHLQIEEACNKDTEKDRTDDPWYRKWERKNAKSCNEFGAECLSEL